MPARTPLSAEEARDERIAQLERSTRRRVTGVQFPVAVLCLLGTLFLLAREAPDVAYIFASREPVTLGSEAGYQLDRLRPNVYAQIHGVPLGTAFYGVDRGARIVLVGLQDTPVVVRRPVLPTEDWVPGKKPPPPDPRPFGVRGRLLPLEDVPGFRDSAARLRALPGLRPVDGRLWVLREGERPGEDRGPLIIALVLLGFGGLNAVLAVRGAQALLQDRAARRRPNLRSV
ncbi:MAG: hypothetical protein ACXWK9_06140 [Myxococcaceae bacterium]